MVPVLPLRRLKKKEVDGDMKQCSSMSVNASFLFFLFFFLFRRGCIFSQSGLYGASTERRLAGCVRCQIVDKMIKLQLETEQTSEDDCNRD